MITRTIVKHPLGLSALPTSEGTNSISTAIGGIIEKHNVLKHPFLQMLSCGAITNDTLRVFVCQYYHLVKHFPRMLSAIHSNTSELLVRKVILKTLNSEDGGKEHSAELWIRFADSLGVQRDVLENSLPLPKTRHFLDTLNNFCRNHSYVEGVASLYAYQVQLPDFFKLHMERLQKINIISEKRITKFFSVRQEKDSVHSHIEREIIEKNVSAENYAKVTYAAEATAYAFWKFFDGIMEVYGKNNKHSFPRVG